MTEKKAAAPKAAVVKAEDWSPSAPVTIENIRKYLPYGSALTPEEAEVAVRRCIHSKLDPFKARPDVYIVKYKEGEPMSLVVAYEVYLRRADALHSLNGWETGTTGEPGQAGFKAWIKIHRKDWTMPFYHEVRWEEYAQYKKWNNKWELTKFWRKMPQTMLVKVVVSQAFRLCFPNSYEDLPYTDAEIPLQADIRTGSEVIEAEVVDIPEAKERKKNLQTILEPIQKAIELESSGEEETKEAPEEKAEPKQEEPKEPAPKTRKATNLKTMPTSDPNVPPWEPEPKEDTPPLESYEDPEPDEQPDERQPGDDEDEPDPDQEEETDPRAVIQSMIDVMVNKYGDSEERLIKSIKKRCGEAGPVPKNVPDDLTPEQAASILKALANNIQNAKLGEK